MLCLLYYLVVLLPKLVRVAICEVIVKNVLSYNYCISYPLYYSKPT